MALQARVLHQLPAVRAIEYSDYAAINPWRLGFALGVARMLSELPNSFLKRQLGIQSGQLAAGIWLPAFYLLDRLDYLPGSWLVASRLAAVTRRRVILSAVLALVVHQLINIIGYFLGMRKTIH
jgi:hypothetical protein